MDIEYQATCGYDYVEVIDGGSDVGEKFCGSVLPDVQTSSGNEMIVRFFSDGLITDRGFRASYVIVEAPAPTPIPCDQTLTDLEGEFTSPNYPNEYENGRECLYTIQVRSLSQYALSGRQRATFPIQTL